MPPGLPRPDQTFISRDRQTCLELDLSLTRVTTPEPNDVQNSKNVVESNGGGKRLRGVGSRRKRRWRPEATQWIFWPR